MPKKALPLISKIEASAKPLTVWVHWSHGVSGEIDLSGVINTYRTYEPLLASPSLFRTVTVGEHGTDIAWTDAIDMSNDTLWRLAQEQSGATMTAAAFQDWAKTPSPHP